MAQQSERITRPELNLEQWPALFVPSQARDQKPSVRVIEREEKLRNGIVTNRISVGYSEHGTLTVKDQRVWYALLQIWDAQGRPEHECVLSVQSLARMVGLQDGLTGRQSVVASLLRLRTVTLTFEQCFFDAETKTRYRDKEPLQILSRLRLATRERNADGIEAFDGVSIFAFHPRIYRNLIQNHTRPVLFDVVLSFRSDTAQLLYSVVDRQLSTKDQYHVTTANLFSILGLQGKDYRYVSARKRAITPALKEVQGKPLSSGGVIESVALTATANKSDLKVTFRRKTAGPEAAVTAPPLPTPAPPPKSATASKRSRLQAPSTPPPDDPLVARLGEAGIAPATAAALAAGHRDAAERQLDAFARRDRSTITDPAAWLVRAIERDYKSPVKAEKRREVGELQPRLSADQGADNDDILRDLLAQFPDSEKAAEWRDALANNASDKE